MNESFSLPLHSVIPESSITMHLRVTFNRSTKASTGALINDNLIVGPRIEQELFTILLRFCSYPAQLLPGSVYFKFMGKKYQFFMFTFISKYSLNKIVPLGNIFFSKKEVRKKYLEGKKKKIT